MRVCPAAAALQEAICEPGDVDSKYGRIQNENPLGNNYLLGPDLIGKDRGALLGAILGHLLQGE